MEASYPHKLDFGKGPSGNGPAGLAVQDLIGIAENEETTWASAQGPHYAEDFAQKLFAYEALNPPRLKPALKEQPEPYSLQWFLDIENQRHSRQGRWIPKLMEFAKHSGEVLLGLGHGLGTDWAQYARQGAAVVVCSSSASQLELVRRNFEVRGLPGQFIHTVPNRLPMDSASIDVACLSSLHMGIDNAPAVVEEVYRVLKPGGKVLAVTPARYNVDFWFDKVFFWYPWIGGHSRSNPALASQRYSGPELKQLFAPFVEHRIYKRQLRRSDVPRIWKWIPPPLLARLMGRVLVLKAFKPLSAALA
jgi:SAM-dependent methyltransferase